MEVIHTFIDYSVNDQASISISIWRDFALQCKDNCIPEDLLLNIEIWLPFLFLGTRNCNIVSNQCNNISYNFPPSLIVYTQNRAA